MGRVGVVEGFGKGDVVVAGGDKLVLVRQVGACGDFSGLGASVEVSAQGGGVAVKAYICQIPFERLTCLGDDVEYPACALGLVFCAGFGDDFDFLYRGGGHRFEDCLDVAAKHGVFLAVEEYLET